MDNIIAFKPYHPGYVSKSGGMSNELNNVLSIVTKAVKSEAYRRLGHRYLRQDVHHCGSVRSRWQYG
jgi:hypothetical protein